MYKILNLDDHESSRYARRRLLESMGWSVVDASTGQEAIAAARQFHPQLALLDVHLPDMSGLEVCRALRGDPETASIQVLQISATYKTEAKIADALNVGADAYLVEPVSETVLAATVNALLRNWQTSDDLRRSRDEAAQLHQQYASIAATEELRRRLLEATIESITPGVAVVAPDGTVMSANRAFRDLHELLCGRPFVCSMSELRQQVQFRTCDGAVIPLERWPGARALHGETVRNHEAEIVCVQSGVFRIVNESAAPVRDAAGQIACAVVTLTDVTEQRLGERALRRSEERFRSLTEAIPNLVWIANPVGGVTFVSSQWCSYTGLAVEECVGSGWLRALHPDDATEVAQSWVRAVDRNEAYNHVYRLRRSDGQYRWHLTRGWPNVSGDGRLEYFGTCTDIHDQHEVVEELRAANQALRESNEELQQFAYALSHDFQEPLRMMASFVEVLQRKYGDQLGPEGAEYIRYISTGSDRMQSMINGLLAYSRAGHQPAEDCATDASRALAWATENLSGAISEAGATIEVEELPCVGADFAKVCQLFQNLLSNAIKYRGTQSLRIKVSAVEVNDFWQFCVADNGPGIPTAYQERIFGIFKRLHGREIPGTGIGLALCRRIVEAHGGRIWVESEPGAGARFHFTIPKATAGKAAVVAAYD